MLDENKALVHRIFEESDRQRTYPAELCAPDFVAHPPSSPPMDLATWQKYVTAYYSAFPDLNITVEQMVAEGDMVAVRVMARGTHTGELMGIPASHKQISVINHAFARISGDKIAEWWPSADTIGLMRQIGAIPLS